MYTETSQEQVEELLYKAAAAFQYLKQRSTADRAALMYAIADKIEGLGDELIAAAMEESRLPEARLVGEKARTIFQWRSYADHIKEGACFEARIDTAIADRTPAKPDLRKIKVGVGPVVVFGASNFPFAFSTGGGDTASAIAAGCPVILKAHPGHLKTSTLMAEAITSAIQEAGWPEGVFSHVYGNSNEAGAYLVQHPLTKSVAFTGSFKGGKALFDLANSRLEPIPVFAEMGSVNPVFVLPAKLAVNPQEFAGQYLASLTLGVGQFCTNPGVVVALNGKDLEAFKSALSEAVSACQPAPMLHEGIAKAYQSNSEKMLTQSAVAVLGKAAQSAAEGQGAALLAETNAKALLANEQLLEEVFGPFGLIVTCTDKEEMLAVAEQLKGQLTITVAATEADAVEYADLINVLQDKCGRLLYNGMPTGVEVSLAMQHGGPFPSTTDSRFTSVGPDAVQRFLRPLSFQNWPDNLLPDALKNANPLGIYRTVNNQLTKEAVGGKL
ncbi:aldehyde dehydrogenase (NADP(+)) [Olivibacter sp. XZL3]|uniref:aldehyde dehydrogenase (NADP(+)) n=1 Tax=Olivibacter sp. XZL3 TaxID=1735116 RepID=UPI001066F2C1|nr:aldehyde dehydrogenase (NADP(+)) [Olivibacter sp. XZL3]